MSLSGQAAPLADREQLRQDIQRLRELAEVEGLSQEELQTALVFRTLIEVRSLDLGGGAQAPRAVGAPAPTNIGTIKAIEFDAQAEANQDILSEDFDVDQRVAVVRTTFALDPGATNSVFSIVLSRGGDENVVDFQAGNALTAGAVYAFDLPLTSDFDINYRIDNQETVSVLVAQEIDTAGP